MKDYLAGLPMERETLKPVYEAKRLRSLLSEVVVEGVCGA